MAFMSKFKDFMGIPQDEETEEEELDIISKEPEEEKKPAPQVTRHANGNKVVNIHTTTQLQVVLVKPERFEDVRPIADHLNSKNTVVLNLESTNKDVSRRLVDFLSGVAYANQGQIQKVANSTYIITPYNVNIMGDLLDELESSGVYFG